MRREARAAAQLTHPGIATVYALEEFGDDLFIAGEFIAGETLREEMSRGPADAARVLETAIELAHALAAAHDRGVMHRDLKPENVIRATDGKLKILDFGLARMRDAPARPGAPDRQPARCSARRDTCRPNRFAAAALTGDPTFSRSASCCTKC